MEIQTNRVNCPDWKPISTKGKVPAKLHKLESWPVIFGGYGTARLLTSITVSILRYGSSAARILSPFGTGRFRQIGECREGRFSDASYR